MAVAAVGKPTAVSLAASALRRRSHVIGSSGLGLLPAIAAFTFAVLWPAFAIFQQSLDANPLGAPGASHAAADNYRTLFEQPIYREAMVRTIRVSLVATVAAVLIGLAIVVALTGFRRRETSSFWLFLLIAPMLSGPIITVLGWMGLFVNGAIGYEVVNALRPLIGGAEGRVLETELAMTVGLVHFLVPFVVLTLYPVARSVSSDLLDVALTLGERPVRTIYRVLIPSCRPGLIAASIVALAMALSAFVNARFLGGERNLVLTTLVNQLVNTFNPTLAAATAAVLVGVGLLLVGVYGRILAETNRRGTV